MPSKVSGKQPSLRSEWFLDNDTTVKEVSICNIQLTESSGQSNAIVDEEVIPNSIVSNLNIGGRTAEIHRNEQFRIGVTFTHDTRWTVKDTRSPLNGSVSPRSWYVSRVTGQRITQNERVQVLKSSD